MTVDVLKPSELTPELVAAWRGFQAADPDLGSPFLTPEWAQVAEQARGPGQVRVAVAHAAGRPTAFLAARRGPFTAVPPGAPLSDYQAIVGAPGADPAPLLRALGVSRYDFTHAPASQTALAPGFRGEDESRMVDLTGGWEGVVASLKARGSDLARDVGKRWRRMDREAGRPTLVADDRDPEAFGCFVGWKREQYRHTRQTDVLAPAWTARLIRAVLDRREPAFLGRFSSLRIDGRIVAGLLTLQSGGVSHAWFIAHDPAFARFSPGMVLIVELTRVLAEAGGTEFDLGPGEYPFKQRLCDRTRGVGYGFVARPSPAAVFREAAYGLRSWAEAAPLGRASTLPAKAMRRWDIVRALG